MIRFHRPVFSDEEFAKAMTDAHARGASLGRLQSGVNITLEDLADEMIRRSLEGVTRYCEKDDILTPWKQQMRKSREIYTQSGVPDSSIRRGMYHRIANERQTWLNSRDGISKGKSSDSRFSRDAEYPHTGAV